MDYLMMNKDDKLLSFRTETSVLGTIIQEMVSYCVQRPYGREGIYHWIDARNYARIRNGRI